MMKYSKHAFYVKSLSCALFGITLLHGATSYAAVSQTPLSLTVGVPPNMLLTLDNSGSMTWAFSPDSINGTGPARRSKSSAFNPIYYNPQATYAAPIVFETDGSETQLPSSFTSARVNGYSSARGTVNLSTDYKVNWAYNTTTGHPTAYGYSNTDNRLSKNAEADFTATATITSSGRNTPAVQRIAASDITFTITRSNSNNNSGCTATASHPSWPAVYDANCTRTNNNEYKASLEEQGVPAYYYVYNPTGANNCTLANESCYSIRFVGETERTNFANWFSFYRNRALATISAAALAFYDLSPSVRLSWQSLSGCQSFDGRGRNCGSNAFQAFSPQHKGELYTWMQGLSFNGGTPLPDAMYRAGEFFKTATPWQKNPGGTGNTTANTYACRASYHILMTDGMWSGNLSQNPSDYLTDSNTFALPDGQRYTGQPPFKDNFNGTLADLAMHYWATDLNPNLANKVPAYIPFKSGTTATDYWDPRNDPATWQHMTNFMMGLGLTQSLSNSAIPWEGSTHTGAGYEALKAGTAQWPQASTGSANNVYDLWHAAINSRGDFFSVDSPEAMVQAFADILSRIADRKSTAARPAINSGQVSSEENGNSTVKTVSYQTSYASDDNWSGDVKRFEKKFNPATSTIETTEVWSAKANVPAPAARRIKIAGTDNSGLAAFNLANAGLTSYSGTTLATYLNRDPENANAVDTKAGARIDYLSGDRTGEGSTYRRRSGVLGDFYSSTPAVVLNTPRYLEQFTNRLEGNTAYTDFKNAIATRTPRVYVGGNAGMLHGFNALTGVEEFAFIPSAVFPKLNKLTGTNYGHEFYVEGSPVVADVYTGTEWRTILVGTLKAGGKSIFALDVTTPGQEKLLWQFDDNSITGTNAVKMGYSFSQPTIARLHTGKWAVVFGNGYESAGNSSGKAALFIVDAMDGSLVRSLEVQGTGGVANGLSTPKLGDYNGDGTADYAYAGDLQGNMWRFDLLRTTRDVTAPFKVTNNVPASNFRVGFSGNPLFKASADNAGNQRQTITSAPSLVAHPTGVGYLVVFGTGRFYDTGDKEGDKSMSQSVYGIWDKETLGEIASNPNISRSTLQAQTITNTTTVSADGRSLQGRILSNNTVRWQATQNGQGGTLPAQNGWYLNLVQADGEMVVENMSQLGRTIFFQSLLPNDDPCGDGAANWTYAINPFTGGRTTQKAFDYTPTTDVGTQLVSAVRQDGEGGGTVSQDSNNTYQYCTGQSCINIYPDPTSIGRQAWRRTEEKE
ncbi:pilus assembly protein [Pseudomonas sp. MM211]|uniref:pilus assembly protein n=1 Tax=Pseudomonas sp. MM211 TaxID=2866808 RepID=UPI001CEC8EC5|nr:PilC/PilY family type IV pilus protein [Pseudomonas sp. MM211]